MMFITLSTVYCPKFVIQKTPLKFGLLMLMILKESKTSQNNNRSCGHFQLKALFYLAINVQ